MPAWCPRAPLEGWGPVLQRRWVLAARRQDCCCVLLGRREVVCAPVEWLAKHCLLDPPAEFLEPSIGGEPITASPRKRDQRRIAGDAVLLGEAAGGRDEVRWDTKRRPVSFARLGARRLDVNEAPLGPGLGACPERIISGVVDAE